VSAKTIADAVLKKKRLTYNEGGTLATA